MRMFLKMMSNFRYLCALILVCMPSLLYSAECPKIDTIKNFEAKQFVGKWYEIQKYPNIWEAAQKCITSDYELNPNGTLNVVNSGLILFANFPVSTQGLITPNKTDPAKLNFKFGSIGLKAEVWVLDTDYQKYALMYSCIPLPILPFNIENAWIMSRTTTLDQQTIDSLKAKLSEVKSPTYLFYPTEQIDCPNRKEFLVE